MTSKHPTVRKTRVQHVLGVDDADIAGRFIGGDSVADLAADYGTDVGNVEGAIRAWAQPYGHLDHAVSTLLDRWLP